MKEKTSIVICAYNEETTIKDVVSKCREFNPESELVVVDDGSQDKTEEILRELNKEMDFRYIRLDKNQDRKSVV